MWFDVLVICVYVLLLLVNAVGVLLVALQLPGTWLILLATVSVAWWRWDAGAIGWWALGALVLLAISGEVLEFIAGAWGARRAGASKRAAVTATICGVIGAILGAMLLSVVPVLGTLFGALLGAATGAGIGSILGDLWAGREFRPALQAGKGAAIGRFMGALGKVAIAAVMWLVVVVALLWP